MQKDIFENYIQSISSKFSHEETSEMGYRTDFEILLKGIFESINVRRVDHDAKAKQGNKPDFIVLNKDVPILYIEAKDIGVSLDKVEKSEQMARYFGYTNLVLTDYVEFRFYRNGLRYEEPIKIADYNLKSRTITPLPENYEHAAKTLLDFTQSQKEPIKSGEHLSKIMGGKAQRIRDNVRHFLNLDSAKNTELFRVYEAIKKMLVHDLTIDTFSDMYAQTLVYGLFVARYYDDSPDTFSRQEARELVPASNPFLPHFFDHIAGPNFDKRFSYIVDELCVVFQHTDTKKLIEEYMGNADPVIHFYEDFLKEYDPELRKKMGAYYTPLPVVRFIIRSVDQILQKDFNLASGLADTSKLPNGKHRVQILDPAVGTGTFISATIRTIYERLKKQGQEGRWPTYVHNDLLPRLHGFELMMAPYTIAHLKLSLAFAKTGFKYFNRRLGIYLTNSLEQNEGQQSLLSFGFAESIAEEAKEADKIKKDTPIMVIVGNPPYSAISSNKTASYLVEKYKVEPGGTERLKERKNWLDDDYVKFISLAENFVEKNGKGILAYITNNSFIDNPTFRGMRWHLLKTFDDIYVVNLHGSAEKDKKSLSGSKDENVFNIKQGVSINIFVKKTENKKSSEFGKVYYSDLFGTREDKFDFLNKNDLESIKWNQLKYTKPYLFFAPKDFKGKDDYEQGFSIKNIFKKSVTGIVTMGDEFIIAQSKKEIEDRLNKLLFENISEQTLYNQYHLGKNYAKWILENKSGNKIILDGNKYTQINYRPFDIKWTYYDKNLVWRCRDEVMNNFIVGQNLGLVFKRGSIEEKAPPIFVSKNIIDFRSWSRSGMQGGDYITPLYLYTEDGSKIPNLKKEIVDEIEKNVGKTTPEDIFDYIYAVLHSPSYREKYKEFLKIDFPRVSYPKDAKTFKKLVAFGAELRSLHLLESPKVNQFITNYPISGSDTRSSMEFLYRLLSTSTEVA
ncbi:MAG: N-6 DNA methylase [Candidatus Falkowbacteria bacterium]|nr:N-6 DNA methylase [Candidatus Falkowbacteria bacterium]